MQAAVDRWGAKWSAFWFAEGSPQALAAFRIVFAVALLEDLRNSAGLCRYAIEGGYHWPYLSGWPLLSPQQFYALFAAQAGLGFLLLVGLRTRLAAAGLFLLQGWVLWADRLNFRNHGYLFWMICGILAVSPAGSALALHRRPSASVRLTAQRLIAAEVTIVYLWAAIQKVHPAYLSGRVLGEILGQPDQALWLQPAAWAVIAVELALPVALWVPRTREVAALVGLAMHAAFALTLNIYGFSLAMVGSYVLFLAPDGHLPFARKSTPS